MEQLLFVRIIHLTKIIFLLFLFCFVLFYFFYKYMMKITDFGKKVKSMFQILICKYHAGRTQDILGRHILLKLTNTLHSTMQFQPQIPALFIALCYSVVSYGSPTGVSKSLPTSHKWGGGVLAYLGIQGFTTLKWVLFNKKYLNIGPIFYKNIPKYASVSKWLPFPNKMTLKNG